MACHHHHILGIACQVGDNPQGVEATLSGDEADGAGNDSAQTREQTRVVRQRLGERANSGKVAHYFGTLLENKISCIGKRVKLWLWLLLTSLGRGGSGLTIPSSTDFMIGDLDEHWKQFRAEPGERRGHGVSRAAIDGFHNLARRAHLLDDTAAFAGIQVGDGADRIWRRRPRAVGAGGRGCMALSIHLFALGLVQKKRKVLAEGDVGPSGNFAIMRELNTVIEGLLCHSDGVDSVLLIDAGIDACEGEKNIRYTQLVISVCMKVEVGRRNKFGRTSSTRFVAMGLARVIDIIILSR